MYTFQNMQEGDFYIVVNTKGKKMTYSICFQDHTEHLIYADDQGKFFYKEKKQTVLLTAEQSAKLKEIQDKE